MLARIAHVDTVEFDSCPEAIGWHQVDARGRCRWCRRRIEPPSPCPTRGFARTTADLAYRYFYDPDFGTDKDDVW